MRRTAAYYYARHSGRCACETISRRCQFAIRQHVKVALKTNPVIDRAQVKKLFPLYASILTLRGISFCDFVYSPLFHCVYIKVLIFYYHVHLCW